MHLPQRGTIGFDPRPPLEAALPTDPPAPLHPCARSESVESLEVISSSEPAKEDRGVFAGGSSFLSLGTPLLCF